MADNFKNLYNGLNLRPLNADPTNPKEGDVFRSNGTPRAKGLWEYKDGAWQQVGSGAGGGSGFNYIENGTAEVNADGWTVYANTTAGVTPDDFGGTPSGNLTFTRNTTTPLLSLADFKLAKAAANIQGEGVYYEFTGENASKTIKHLFSALCNLSELDDGDIRIYLVSSSDSFVADFNVISPNNPEVLGGITQIFKQFQFDANDTDYRLCIHYASTDTTAKDAYFDQIELGFSINGAGGNNEVVVTGESNGGTSITANVTDIDFTEVIDNSNSWNGTQFTAPESGNYGIDGLVRFTTSGIREVLLYLNGSVKYMIGQPGGSTVYTQFNTQIYLNKGDFISFRTDISGTLQAGSSTHHIHIQKLGTSSEASVINSGRDIIVRGEGNGSTSITAGTTPIDFTGVTNTTSSWNGTVFDAPESGLYLFEGQARFTVASTGNISLYLNEGAGYVNKQLIGCTKDLSEDNKAFKGLIYLNKGDLIQIRFGANVTLDNSSNSHFINITKLSSAKALLETETVAARYTSDSGQTIGTGFTDMIFEDVDFDSHNAYNISTGEYTIQLSGYYIISAAIERTTFTFTLNTVVEVAIIVDGINKKFNGPRSQASTSSIIPAQVTSTPLYLTKGQVVKIQARSTASSGSATTGSAKNNFEIIRLKL